MAIDPRDKELSKQRQKIAVADALQADEFRSVEDWQKHYLPNGTSEQSELPQLRDGAHTIGEDAANVAIGEREAFLTWWCADVPEYMREKWKESVDECLRNNHAQDKLVGAWDGFQFGLTVARAALTAEKVAARALSKEQTK